MPAYLQEDLSISRLHWVVLLILSAVAGGLSTLAFAPYNHVWLIFVSQAIVFTVWQQLTPLKAWFSGWLYGLVLQGTGVGWIYYSLHVHGGSPAPFAVGLVFLLACYLGIYNGLTAYVVVRFCPQKPVLRLLFFYPASWVVFEWLQGYVLTGFAWMQTGYTQIDTALAGYAPVLGNHALSGLVAMTAGALSLFVIYLFQSIKQGHLLWQKIVYVLVPAVVLWAGGMLLKPVNWTQPQGHAIKVSLVQGNIPQSQKWLRSMHQHTLDLYKNLTLTQAKDSKLIVWPETAIPDFSYRVQPFITYMKQAMAARHSALVLGIFSRNRNGKILNSVLNVDGQIYNKRHLVPLGEYIPLRPLIDFFRQWVDIPMSDLASGEAKQSLMMVAGIPVGISICFEEAFARNIRETLPAARLLINVSNDAWFEDSSEPSQHLAIARMRALESGRYLLRATNTGISALIGPHGEVIKQAPLFKQAVLTGSVQALRGATPYISWGEYPILLICLFPLVLCLLRSYTLKY